MRDLIQSSARLSAFAAAVILILSALFWGLRPSIHHNQQREADRFLRELAPNDTFPETRARQCYRLGEALLEYERSEQGNWFIRTRTLRGYNGEIALLLALSADTQTLLGVRVLQHRETVGLGDKIERRKSAWIEAFRNRDARTRFALKQDGGDFDGLTGATITPRAVVQQVGAVFLGWAQGEVSACPDNKDKSNQ